MRVRLIDLILPCIGVLAFLSCSSVRKLDRMKEERLSPVLTMSEDSGPVRVDRSLEPHNDTLVITDREGREMLVMNAVKDENGEMVAVDRIVASVVTARFKNVAERHGKVDLRFDIDVPPSMTDGRWQLRLTPSLHMMGVSTRLDSIQITGLLYRKAQLKGYQQYRRYLNSIIRDSTLFIRVRDLENFISRNLPEIYAFRNDSSYVSDEEFSSKFGVTQREAVTHYTDHFRKNINRRRIAMIPKKFRQYVKAPLVTEGIRLDTVMAGDNGGLKYCYVQTVNTCPGLKKAMITISGGVYEEDRRIYSIAQSDTLSFYISTLGSLLDNTEKYLSRVVSRRVTENSICWISFRQGSSVVEADLDNNATEIGRIKKNLSALLENREFDLDSITVSASSSPEGSLRSNERLSALRSESVCRHFEGWTRHVLDSLRNADGVMLDIDGRLLTKRQEGIRFIPHCTAENWEQLFRLVSDDRVLDEGSKEEIAEVLGISDLDAREKKLSTLPSYRYLRENIYPSLRTVRFNFYLHRRGMVKDTVVTTELDSTYMRGVQAVRDRDYETAVTLLRPYHDYNTAIAYCSMDYNASAMEILKTLPRTPPVLYMLAVLHSRYGDDRSAVECYLEACAMEPSYIHRGNLDPEISTLIKRYGLVFED